MIFSDGLQLINQSAASTLQPWLLSKSSCEIKPPSSKDLSFTTFACGSSARLAFAEPAAYSAASCPPWHPPSLDRYRHPRPSLHRFRQSAFILCRKWNGFGGLILGVASQIADNAHRNFLIQRSLNRCRQGNAFNSEVVPELTQLANSAPSNSRIFLRQQNGSQPYPRMGYGAAKRCRQLGDCNIAQLVFQVYAAVRAATPLTSFEEFCRTLIQ